MSYVDSFPLITEKQNKQ